MDEAVVDEAKIHQSLVHENVVRLIDHGVDSDRHVVMSKWNKLYLNLGNWVELVAIRLSL